MAIKMHDFVELDYTGKLTNGTIFDTTDEKIAKAARLNRQKFGSVIVCVGEGHIVSGLDRALVGKDAGKKFSVSLPCDAAFGKKDAKLIQLVPFSVFKEQRVAPQPGLVVDIDGTRATILRSSGGRVMVDFNHPLAGKDVVYEITVKRLVTDASEKIQSYFSMVFPLQSTIAVVGNRATITLMQQIPLEITSELSKKLSEITGLTVEFSFSDVKK